MATVGDLFEAALTDHRSGRLPAAITGYHRVIAVVPVLAGAWVMIGVGRSEKGDFAASLDALSRALAVEPLNVDALANKSFTLIRAGQVSAAVRTGRATLVLAPGSVVGAVNLATALLRKGAYAVAELWLMRADVLVPRHPSVHSNLINIHIAGHRWQAAEASCRHVLAADPNNRTVLRQLATVLHHQGRTSEEAESLDRLLRLDADQPDVYRALMTARKSNASSGPAAQNHAHIGRQHEQSRRLVEASEAFASAIAFDPADATLHDALNQVVDAGFADLETRDMPEHERTRAWFVLTQVRAIASYRRALLRPPPPPTRPARIYDYFTFFNEFELLDIRLAELADCVDGFVIVESIWTNRGDPKPLLFAENRDRYATYADRIRHVVLTEKRSAIPAQQFVHQKDHGLTALEHCDDWDLVTVCDVDEIPRPSALRAYRDRFQGVWDVARLSMDLYQYFMNLRTYRRWTGAAVLPCAMARLISPMSAQVIAGQPESGLGLTIPDAGWHFTWMGGAERVLTKLKSFGHKELDTPAVASMKTISDRLARRENVVDHTGEFTAFFGALEVVDVDETFPQSVRARKDRLQAADFLIPAGPRA